MKDSIINRQTTAFILAEELMAQINDASLEPVQIMAIGASIAAAPIKAIAGHEAAMELTELIRGFLSTRNIIKYED